MCYGAPDAANLPVYVAREDHATYLRSNGIRDATAIGLPFVYTPRCEVSKRPNSLLVVPTHTLSGDSADTFEDRTSFQKYASEIAAVRSHFDEIWACIHPSCAKNGLWIEEMKSAGCNIVQGASVGDRNALLRMKTLFSTFGYVTTNGWGSHIPYAMACGAMVSVHGTKPDRTLGQMLRDSTWAENPDAAKRAVSPATKEKESQFLGQFRCLPHLAKSNAALGRKLIGADHKVSRRKMRQLLANAFEQPLTLLEKLRPF